MDNECCVSRCNAMVLHQTRGADIRNQTALSSSATGTTATATASHKFPFIKSNIGEHIKFQ
jgi:hypothetical protein